MPSLATGAERARPGRVAGAGPGAQALGVRLLAGAPADLGRAARVGVLAAGHALQAVAEHAVRDVAGRGAHGRPRRALRVGRGRDLVAGVVLAVVERAARHLGVDAGGRAHLGLHAGLLRTAGLVAEL